MRGGPRCGRDSSGSGSPGRGCSPGGGSPAGNADLGGTRTMRIQVLGALSGEARCVVAADPSWPVARLRTEISALTGVPEAEQRLLLPGAAANAAATLERDGAMSVHRALGGDEDRALLLLRVNAAPPGPGGAPVVDAEPGAVLVSAAPDRGEAGAAQVATWVVDPSYLLARNPTCEASPEFKLELAGYGPAAFKMILVPQGASTFRRSQGRGRVQLKCFSPVERGVAPVRFSIAVQAQADAGGGEAFTHDFARSALWAKEHEPVYLHAGAAVARQPGGRAARSVVLIRLEVLGGAGCT